jgi:glucose/mannose-6-phosphate isomerase
LGRGKDDIAVVIFRHKEDHERSQIRMEINKEVFRSTPRISTTCGARATPAFARQLYLINLGDWVSYYWAEKKGVDPTEIAVINMLKGKLAEVK